MRTVQVTAILLESEAEAKQYLRSIGVKGPSLHPRVASESTRDRWNGWNFAKAAGIDADGYPVKIASHHYASGWTDFSGQTADQMGRLGSIAFDGFRWPITVFHAKAIILHPEHTPTDSED
jgi:hypothetical protein